MTIGQAVALAAIPANKVAAEQEQRTSTSSCHDEFLTQANLDGLFPTSTYRCHYQCRTIAGAGKGGSEEREERVEDGMRSETDSCTAVVHVLWTRLVARNPSGIRPEAGGCWLLVAGIQDLSCPRARRSELVARNLSRIRREAWWPMSDLRQNIEHTTSNIEDKYTKIQSLKSKV